MTGSGFFEKYPTVTLFFRAAYVAAGHCEELFLNKADDLFIRNMVWILGAIEAKAEMGTATSGSNIWKEAVAL